MTQAVIVANMPLMDEELKARLDRIEELLLILVDTLTAETDAPPLIDLDGGLHPTGGDAQSLDD